MRTPHSHIAMLCRVIWPPVFGLGCLIMSSAVVEVRSETAPLAETRVAANFANLSSDEAEYYAETCHLFRIADPQFFKKTLSKAPDLSRFRDCVKAWIKNHESRWTEMRSRLDYCRRLQSTGALATSLTSPQRDVRWDLFLEHGPPVQARVLPLKDRMNAPCSVWTYTWLAPDSAQTAHASSCKSMPGDAYPSQLITPDRDGFLSALLIEPLVQSSFFPTREGSGELWFSIWVKGDELSRPTLDLARLAIRVELYNQFRSKLIAEQTSFCDLQLLRGVLEASDRASRQYIRAMEYVVFPGVAGGSYQAHVTVCGASANDGDRWLAVDVPGQSRISDLLILHPVPASSHAEQTGIVRSTRGSLYNNPEAVLAPGSSLSLYAEALLPQEYSGSFEVSVTLLAIPAVTRSRKSSIEVGNAIAVADSLNRPLENRAFNSLPQSQLDSLLRATTTFGQVIEIYRKRFSSDTADNVIEVSCPLSRNLKTSQYLLTLTITDPNQQRFFLPTRRTIQIVKPGSLLSRLPN